MAEWVARLRQALQDEFAAKPRIATLATVDQNGLPRCRTVVCRGMGDDGRLWVASDSRSEKNAQVRAVPFVELTFWLPTARQQFRVRGRVEVINQGESWTRAWTSLSDTARALFFWDAPGGPAGDDREAPGLVPATTPAPGNFEVLVVVPARVEHLDVKPHPHARTLWRVETNWTAEAINP